MKKILILGAGRSANVLIQRLIKTSESNQWLVDVADLNYELAKVLVGENDFVKAIKLEDGNNFSLVRNYDIVASMLPVNLHYEVAKACVYYSKHLVTASYNTPEIQSLDSEAKNKSILILMECGLDPGIDHMSAMQIIDEIQSNDGIIKSFKSYCGGLMTAESDLGNPWKYKITWNPRNVVLAGQGGIVKYLEDKELKYLNYSRLFLNPQKIVIGDDIYEGYPNRDSLKYVSLYSLTSVETFVRGTLRKDGFCKAWHALSFLGFTDDSYHIENLTDLSYLDFFNLFSPVKFSKNWQKDINRIYPDLIDNEIVEKMNFLGLFSNDKIYIQKSSPAILLQHLVENKLKTTDKDIDLVVMQHQFEYMDVKGNNFKKESSLIIEGNQNPNTAMSTSVGLPVYHAIEMILNNQIDNYGVKLPTEKWIYCIILDKLSKDGIRFTEKTELVH